MNPLPQFTSNDCYTRLHAMQSVAQRSQDDVPIPSPAQEPKAASRETFVVTESSVSSPSREDALSHPISPPLIPSNSVPINREPHDLALDLAKHPISSRSFQRQDLASDLAIARSLSETEVLPPRPASRSQSAPIPSLRAPPPQVWETIVSKKRKKKPKKKKNDPRLFFVQKERAWRLLHSEVKTEKTESDGQDEEEDEVSEEENENRKAKHEKMDLESIRLQQDLQLAGFFAIRLLSVFSLG